MKVEPQLHPLPQTVPLSWPLSTAGQQSLSSQNLGGEERVTDLLNFTFKKKRLYLAEQTRKKPQGPFPCGTQPPEPRVAW